MPPIGAPNFNQNKEIFAPSGTINVSSPSGRFPTSPAIRANYLLIPGPGMLGAGSAPVGQFGRLRQDSTWSSILGGSLTIFELDNSSSSGYRATILGRDVLAGEQPLHTIIHDTWFAWQFTDNDANYALVSMLDTPMGSSGSQEYANDQATLASAFPAAEGLIARFFPPATFITTARPTEATAATSTTSTAGTGRESAATLVESSCLLLTTVSVLVITTATA